MPILTEREKKMLNALLQSVRVMRQWHGFVAFDLYYHASPDMMEIRDLLDSVGMSYQDIITNNRFVE